MAGIECRNTDTLIDEIRRRAKDIDQVITAGDLVEAQHTPRQVVNVKRD